jgi:adenine deaminase
MVASDTETDILKLTVIGTNPPETSTGLVQGFGLKSGALAGSVAHDSHNIIVVGVSDQDMRHATEEIAKMQGGFVAVQGGGVKASLPLPVAGLMSLESAETVASRMEKLKEAARDLGCPLHNPFLTLSFLALPVIPELKLTDRGLVDVPVSIISLEALE